MMQFFIAMTSLFLASAYAASLEEKLTQKTDLFEEFDDLTTILPDSPRILDMHSCSYSGTCPSLINAKNCQRCQLGYVKDPEDDTKCKYVNEDENAFLLTTSLENIRLISLDGKNTTVVMQDDRFSYSSGINYNFRTNTLFWFNHTDRTIYSAPLLNYVNSERKSIMHDNSSDIYGTAVDWIYNHIYWVDVRRHELVVSNFNGTIKKVLFSDRMSWPLSIVVNPLSGWMYWADSTANHIERAGLDGSRREVILNIDISDPQSLALDLVQNRLYWSQGSSFSTIWSSNVDGSDRQMVFKATEELKLTSVAFRKIAMFDKYIYCMDWRHNVVYKVNKCNGQDLEIVHNSTYSLWDLHTYHSSMQPEGENLCSKRIDQCSHFCFPAPSPGKSSVSVLTTKCACPVGLFLDSDSSS